ncbi:MAG: hypothetical protein LBL39_01145 [Planctomycetaceae bacterium]|jgi:hypothetical protein|nr:hypothetical protein [Planctomycetaceae bacterium]
MSRSVCSKAKTSPIGFGIHFCSTLKYMPQFRFSITQKQTPNIGKSENVTKKPNTNSLKFSHEGENHTKVKQYWERGDHSFQFPANIPQAVSLLNLVSFGVFLHADNTDLRMISNRVPLHKF